MVFALLARMAALTKHARGRSLPDIAQGIAAMLRPGYLWGVTMPLGFMFFALNFAAQGDMNGCVPV